MTTGNRVRWYRILQEHDGRRIRSNVLLGVYLPLLVGIAIVSLVTFISPAGSPPPGDAELGGMSGGGGGDRREYDMAFGPTAGDEATVNASAVKSVEVQLLKIRIITPGAPAARPAVNAKSKAKQRQQAASVPGPPPVRRIRGAGAGSGGGTGGGSGGGIGAGVGYSIDWGGTGSRRLLSGRLPKYPAGTEAEMAISIRFTVLGDGTVSGVVPVRRGDEILEREAESAVRTWRFEALSPAMSDKTQTGSVIFNFRLDQSTPVRR